MSIFSRLTPFPPRPPTAPNPVQPPKGGHVHKDPSGPGGQGVVVDVFDPNRVAMRATTQPTQSLVDTGPISRGDPSGTTGGPGIVVGTLLEILRRLGIGNGKPPIPPNQDPFA